MHVKLTQKALSTALDPIHRVVVRPVRRVVERPGTIPILSNVRIVATAAADDAPASLQLTGTDMDREVTVSSPAEVSQPGETTVPAGLLLDIVKKLPSGAEVTLAVDDEGRQMTVASGRSRFRLQCLPAGDFPDIARSAMSNGFTLSSDAIRSLFGRVAFAISREETRFYLGGVHLHVLDDAGVDQRILVAVATDGHRLAKIEMVAPEGSTGMPGIIVPAGAVEEILKLVGKSDAEVAVRLSDTAIEFTVGSTTLFSKLIDGTFPDYRRVIPIANPERLVVGRVALADAVERVTTVSTDRGRGLRIALDEKQIVLSMSAPDAGSATETVDAAFAGKPFEVGYNSKYLTTALGAFTSETLEFRLADPGSPAVITDEMADDGLTVVLMPMRV